MSPSRSYQVPFKLQKLQFVADFFFILPLKGYNMVLGTQWLRTLGPIHWDFEEILMKFNKRGKEINLQGIITNPREKLISNNSSTLCSRSQKGVIVKVVGRKEVGKRDGSIPPNIGGLLGNYQQVFTKPVELPP